MAVTRSLRLLLRLLLNRLHLPPPSVVFLSQEFSPNPLQIVRSVSLSYPELLLRRPPLLLEYLGSSDRIPTESVWGGSTLRLADWHGGRELGRTWAFFVEPGTGEQW